MGFFKKKKETDDGYYQGPGLAKLSSIVCARCGCDLHLIRKDQIKTINGKQYCDVCADYFKRLASAPKHFCVACNRIFPAPEMTTIYGNRICNECASKYWSGKLPGLKLTPVNAPTGRINVAGKTSDLIRKTAPANVLCVKCGTSMVNDGTGIDPSEPAYVRLPIRKINADLSCSLEAFIEKCVDPNPEKRYSSAKELMKSLDAIS